MTTRIALLCVALLACKGQDTGIKPKAGSATGSATKAGPLPPVPTATKPPDDLCDAFDRSGVATAFGWKGLQKTSATGYKHGDEHKRTCSYRGLDDKYKEAIFGAAFSTNLTFEPRHIGLDITYAKHAPIDGNEVMLGKSNDAVALQIIAHGLRISTDVTRAGVPDDLEPKLVEATKKIIASLPSDPLPLMHK